MQYLASYPGQAGPGYKANAILATVFLSAAQTTHMKCGAFNNGKLARKGACDYVFCVRTYMCGERRL